MLFCQSSWQELHLWLELPAYFLSLSLSSSSFSFLASLHFLSLFFANLRWGGMVKKVRQIIKRESTGWWEILKLRSIQDIIDLLNDPRLSRHAAYALCNQAGNKKGFLLLLFFFFFSLSPPMLYFFFLPLPFLVDIIFIVQGISKPIL